MAVAGEKLDAVAEAVDGFHAAHACPLVVSEIGHGFGFVDPGIPDYGVIGAVLLDADATSGGRVLNLGGAIRVHINPIGFCGEINGTGLNFVGAVFEFVQIGGSLQAFDLRDFGVGHIKITVQSIFESAGAVAVVDGFQFEGEAVADGDAVFHSKAGGDHFALVTFRGEAQTQTAASILKHGGFQWRPGTKSRHPVGGKLVIVLIRTKPGPTNGNTAPDGLTVGKMTFFTHPQNGLFSYRLKGGDMGTVQIDGGGRSLSFELKTGEVPFTGSRLEMAGNCKGGE